MIPSSVPSICDVLKGPPILESLLWSVVRFWAARETKDMQLELLERHLRQDEMINGLFQLCGMAGEPMPLKRQQSYARTATKAQAEYVVKLYEIFDKSNLPPRFMFHCDELLNPIPQFRFKNCDFCFTSQFSWKAIPEFSCSV